MCSVAYYPLIGHSIVSQIHTAPDSLSSCSVFKPEISLLCDAEPERNGHQLYQRILRGTPGDLHFPGQGNVAKFVPY